MKRDLAIYVHIPFCVSKCYYCDFLSGLAGQETIDAYVKALLNEIRSYARFEQEYEVKTIFIGGGTPSSIHENYIEEIMNTILEVFHISKNDLLIEEKHAEKGKNILPKIETTIEINPGIITEKKLRKYYKCGINRISFGLQSANDKELKTLGRIHTYEQFYHNYQLARNVGFQNINIDLMSSLPNQTKQSFVETLNKIVHLNPEHISAYSLIIEENTPFWFIYGENHLNKEEMQSLENNDLKVSENVLSKGRMESSLKEAIKRNKNGILPDEDIDRSIYEETKRYLKEYGYERYEISNYAKAGYECKHNCCYWKRRDYLGIGLGASSLIHETRFHNTTEINQYTRMANNLVSKDKMNEIHEEVTLLTVKDQMEEFMFLGLRMIHGISKQKFRDIFHCSFETIYGKVVSELLDEMLIIEENDQIKLTDYGIDISNYVLSQFLLEDNN